MNDPLLHIGIPTRNRCHLLRELIGFLVPNAAHLVRSGELAISVVDNASTDDTRKVAQSATGIVGYVRHGENIGACENAIWCYTQLDGDYVWVLGDDDVITTGAIERVLTLCKQQAGDWILLSCGDPDERLMVPPPPSRMESSDWFSSAAKHSPYMLLYGGMLPVSVIRRGLFDAKATASIPGNAYTQWLGIVSAAKSQRASIYLDDWQTIIPRSTRPLPSGRILPPRLDESWDECCAWLAREFDLNIDPKLFRRTIMRRAWLGIAKQPVRSFLRWRRYLTMPSAYPQILKRLCSL